MAKFASTLLLVGIFISVQALPPAFEDVVAAAKENQWDQVHQLLRNNFAGNAEFKPAVFEGVRNLKPVDGGHVYGEAEYSFHSASNINGKTTEDQAGGHKVINNDGKVKEFDFKPKTNLPLVIQPINLQAQIANDYSASDLNFPFARSSVNQSPDHTNIGGKKPVYNVKIEQPSNLPIPSFTSIPSQGAQGGHSQSYNNQYSYSHSNSHQFLNGKPVDVSNGGNFPVDPQKFFAPIAFTDVRDLKPPQGGKVFGEAQFQYHTTSNVDGKVTEDQGGHKVINDNGKVQEFDFDPSSKKSPVTTYFN